ncbi:MAG: tRNA lysidine(34) synthetase TilS [Actinobacteria bacterium RBG_16_64_13]|nr:MAG: tRNA lysidine(34) synthetase TilS [Actinobacteria bacterium RBG_16_64_13]
MECKVVTVVFCGATLSRRSCIREYNTNPQGQRQEVAGPVASDVEPRRRGRPSLARKAGDLMTRERLFPDGSRVLAMVSGGQDSLALLHLLAAVAGREGFSLHALHVNHHLRGTESDDDEALVVRVCARLGVGLTVAHRSVDKSRGNVQETAREARREAALAVAAERDCDRIALGHTADDQVETMLYRLGRYGGMAAFAGMKQYDPPWVRPFLGCRREETAAYCGAHGLDYARDRGNAYPGYARTAIRERVLPELEAALPGAVGAACRAAEVAAEVDEVIAAVLAEAASGVVKRDEAGAGRLAEGAQLARADTLSVPGLLGLTPAVRRLLLHQWLAARARPAASRAGVLAVEALLTVSGSAGRALGGGWRAHKEYGRLSVARGPRSAPAPRPPVALPVPGQAQWDDRVVTAEHAEAYAMPDISSEAFVDADCLAGPLEVRAPKPGDRLRPLGAPGTRKLQDVLVDLRVAAAERGSWPLVVCGERIVWVCGLVLAEEGRIGPNTAAVVRLSLSRRPASGEADEEGGHAKGERS